MFSLCPQSSHTALKASLERQCESPDLGKELAKLSPLCCWLLLRAGSTYGRQEGSESQETCEDVYTFTRLPALIHPGPEVESGREIGKSRLRRERIAMGGAGRAQEEYFLPCQVQGRRRLCQGKE